MNRWPSQLRAVAEFKSAVAAGERRIVLTAPTGGGKTVIVIDLANLYLAARKKVVFYTNRKMLVEQVTEVLDGFGIAHGVRQAGVIAEPNFAFQVASIQTEHARSPVSVYRRFKRRGASDSLAKYRAESVAWELHAADLVIVDEGHLHTQETSQRIIKKHLESGAVVVYVTATPLGMAAVADIIIVAGTNSELRGYDPPALVPARHYGCDEPQYSKKALAKLSRGEDLTDAETAKIVMTEGIFGRVFEWYRRLNPAGLPTILFAPGVRESIWFAEEFYKRGVTAAHIDGDEVWINGDRFASTRERRDKILAMSKDRRLNVLCNRFVLREGVDAPWLAHGIFATVFGSLQSYLQSGGRLLRASHGLSSVTIQDHGGNWHRFGSLNADRTWELGMTSRIAAGVRTAEFENPGPLSPPQPFLCPACKGTLVYAEIRVGNTGTCPMCGHKFDFTKRSRSVAMSNGILVEHFGDVFKPKRTRIAPNTAKLWEGCYWRGRSAKNWNPTFNQLIGLFVRENWYEPPRSLPLMPVRALDWYYKVKDVPFDRLIPRPIKERS